MKKTVILVLGILLMASYAYGGSGDFIVSGNLGVGTTTPAYKLDVNGTLAATTYYDKNNAAYFLIPSGSSNLNGATFTSGPYTNDYFRINGSGGIYWQNWGGGWYMSDSTWIRAFSNKGIYTGGQIYAGGQMRADGGFCIGGDCRTVLWSTGAATGSGTANYLSKWTGASSVGNSLIYDDGINVGIGNTTFPAGIPGLSVKSTGPAGGGITVGGSGYQEVLNLYADTTNNYAGIQVKRPGVMSDNLILQEQGGNVGIGTRNPSQKLDVAGYVNGQTGLCMGNDCRTAWPPVGVGGSGTANYLSKWTGASSVGNSLIYDDGINVGIGNTTFPAGITGLSVKSTGLAGGGITVGGSGYQEVINIYADTTNNYAGIQVKRPGVTSDNLVLQEQRGNVGIGVTTPSYQLQLSSDLAAKLSTGTWTVTSDGRLKTNVQPYTKGLKELLQINPVTYKYNGKGGIGHYKFKDKDPITGDDIESETVDSELLAKTHVGVVAQDIQSIVPESVSSHKGKINDDDTEKTDILDFNSHALTFILINAVKELKAEIDSLNKQIADLKGKVK